MILKNSLNGHACSEHVYNDRCRSLHTPNAGLAMTNGRGYSDSMADLPLHLEVMLPQIVTTHYQQ